MTEQELREWQGIAQSLAMAEAELKKKLDEYDEKIDAEVARRTGEIAEKEKRLEEAELRVSERERKLDEAEAELERREAAVSQNTRQNEREQRRLKMRNAQLEEREDDLEQLVQERAGDKIREYEARLAEKEQALKDRLARIAELTARQDEIEAFKVSIGSSPEIIQKRLEEADREIEELKAELGKRPSEDIKKERDDLKEQNQSLKAEAEDLRRKNRELETKNGELAGFEMENIRLKSRCEDMETINQELQGQTEKYRERLLRLSSPEERLSSREERIAQISGGYFGEKPYGFGMPMELSEMEWLDNIGRQCDQYGMHFPRRILYAFHTALKISDWSILTVLAGVSGTGKSELPRLYAAFGGLNFINVPVQPDWDSQESMLGFFNSIDNCFQPEPLLRFLVECTEKEGFKENMSIVLLDEMNLAYVEHYFADFLSKLETRRGTTKKDGKVPCVDVKLGAGVEPYPLRLERSILWTGTMNQDETTKSLSDKVLDRGLVIHFPRPRSLKSRENMNSLEKAVEASGRPMLTTKKWGSWVVRQISVTDDQKKEIDKYRHIVEEINDVLEEVGRALGHRVWQSIEYYILNYPTVRAEMSHAAPGELTQGLRAAMRTAFEDQIVQKIMPKLRGVETRGTAKKSLDKIEEILENNEFDSLQMDFENACTQGYGQFIWASAKYIEAEEAELEAREAAEATQKEENQKEADPWGTSSEKRNPGEAAQKEADSEETDPWETGSEKRNLGETDQKEANPEETDPWESGHEKMNSWETDQEETDPNEADTGMTDDDEKGGEKSEQAFHAMTYTEGE